TPTLFPYTTLFRSDEQKAEHRDEEIGPERVHTGADDRSGVSGSRRHQGEEVLVAEDEDGTRQEVGAAAEVHAPRDPGQTDRERDRAPDDPRATGKATAGENKQRDPEERAFRASEEQQADERTGDRAETRVAVRGEREREKETGAEKRGDDE